MLDLGTDETFTEEATFSLDCAKQMFQRMLEGEQVPEPQMHDDLLVFYTTMYRAIQSYRFKTLVPPELQAPIFEYIKTLEGLMFLKSQKNQKLAMEIQLLSYYPAFFEIPAPEPSLTEEEAMLAEQKMQSNEAINTENMKHAQEQIETAQKAEAGQQ